MKPEELMDRMSYRMRAFDQLVTVDFATLANLDVDCDAAIALDCQGHTYDATGGATREIAIAITQATH